MCAVFVGLLINSSHGQSADNSSNTQSLPNFLNYTNNDKGFTIQYPSNWKFEEYSTSISFRVPDREFGGIFWVEVEKVEPYLDTDTMTLKNTTLRQYVQQKLDVPYYSNLIRENETTVGGNTGWKIEYYNQNFDYKFEINTIVNGKLYTLSYSDDPLKVPETLPLANKMVESFQFIKYNSPKTIENIESTIREVAFRADLASEAEVPPLFSEAYGSAFISGNNSMLRYKINATSLDKVSGVYLYKGDSWENGQILVSLLNSTEPSGHVDGILLEGTINSSNILATPANNLSNLIDLMNQGMTYINIHTSDFPDGEIRGQLAQ
jgi:hypothetical protein